MRAVSAYQLQGFRQLYLYPLRANQCQHGSYRDEHLLLQQYRTRKIYEGWVNAPVGLH